MPDLILHTTCLMSCRPPFDHDTRVSLNVDTFGVYYVMVERDLTPRSPWEMRLRGRRGRLKVPTEWSPLSVDAQFPELADAVRHMADVIERLASEGGA